MLLAFVQRASTFVLNVLLQRAMLSAAASDTRQPRNSALEEYGAAAITLDLISSTALFLAREPFRVALARSKVPIADEKTWVAGGNKGVAPGQQLTGERERARRRRRRREAYRRRFVNTAWISAPVGLAFAGLVRLAYPWVIRNDDFQGVEENRQAASLVCLAAAVELMCEPLALIFQYRLLVDVRVRAEAAAVLVLGVSRYLLVTRAGMGVLSFGYAQLFHSVTLFTWYVLFAVKDVARARAGAETTLPPPPPSTLVAATGQPPGTARPLAQDGGDDEGFARVRGWLPSRPIRDDDSDESGLVDSGKLRLAWALAGQSLLKHVLTEGDKIVLARATSSEHGCHRHSGGGCSQGGTLYEQGVYAIASGYGSLAARLLFQPLEEAARLMFSKLGAEAGESRQGAVPPAVTATSKALTMGATHSSLGRGGGQGRQDGGGGYGQEGDSTDGAANGKLRLRAKMASLLATLLKLVLMAGLVFVCFGFHYTETLLRLLLAGKGGGGGFSAVSEVARVLSWYCVYVLFLAANGMCEAFACAVAQGGQLTGMGAGLVASFAAFWVLVGPLTGRFGTRGLVMANAAGMACRVICSGLFIRRFFLRRTTPATPSLKPAAVGDRAASGESSRLSPSGSPHRSPSEPSRAPPNGGERRKKTATKRNLWREVVTGAVPHPGVVSIMALSSAAAYATSPAARHVAGGNGGAPLDAAKHVGVGLVCFLVTAAVFVKCEGAFLRELGALWAARRPPGPDAGRGAGSGDAAALDGADKSD
ncbi:conserved unknown protein [Ectocarpus siliculosus]|uniref:Protein RFT1 homolog n=1 Tax=Ectocarpus siliculosus TaxID=2880 RepID=D7G2R7_ECTSI|nr:conserved unknown protein [Ectocarpus siliculosus]|eukprot:CBJ26892.1 conserved unknown protein [Ectocarpus siliculosus]